MENDKRDGGSGGVWFVIFVIIFALWAFTRIGELKARIKELESRRPRVEEVEEYPPDLIADTVPASPMLGFAGVAQR